jgi:hypothetical protein
LLLSQQILKQDPRVRGHVRMVYANADPNSLTPPREGPTVTSRGEPGAHDQNRFGRIGVGRAEFILAADTKALETSV